MIDWAKMWKDLREQIEFDLKQAEADAEPDDFYSVITGLDRTVEIMDCIEAENKPLAEFEDGKA